MKRCRYEVPLVFEVFISKRAHMVVAREEEES
jgi:hypothetical protein